MMELSQLAQDAAKGAAMGSVVPGVGTALGAVGGVVLDLAPEVGRWLFGANSAPVVAAVQAAVGAATGTQDEEAQAVALADPAKAGALRIELARIAAEQEAAVADAARAELTSRLADLAGARASTLDLARTQSVIAWGAPLVSVVVLLTFGIVVTVALTQTLPATAAPVLNVLMGTLGAMATSVVSYWVGSSAGSARKDERLASLVSRM